MKIEKKILLVSTCKEKLHKLEFIKPVADILAKNKIKFFIKHYKNLNKKDLEKARKIIICGTALKDNEYFCNIEKFNWILKIKKPLLGICSGMQIIAFLFHGKIEKKTEIGVVEVKTKTGKRFKVYTLHNFYVSPTKDFIPIAHSKKCVQIIKHKSKPVYGMLFHPEVLNKDLILKFVNNEIQDFE